MRQSNSNIYVDKLYHQSVWWPQHKNTELPLFWLNFVHLLSWLVIRLAHNSICSMYVVPISFHSNPVGGPLPAEVCKKVAYGVSEGGKPDLAPFCVWCAAVLMGVRSVESVLQLHCLKENMRYWLLRVVKQILTASAHHLLFFTTARSLMEVKIFLRWRKLSVLFMLFIMIR